MNALPRYVASLTPRLLYVHSREEIVPLRIEEDEGREPLNRSSWGDEQCYPIHDSKHNRTTRSQSLYRRSYQLLPSSGSSCEAVSLARERVCRLQLLVALASAGIRGSESRGTNGRIILSQI
jgi:hypothetical protein